MHITLQNVNLNRMLLLRKMLQHISMSSDNTFQSEGLNLQNSVLLRISKLTQEAEKVPLNNQLEDQVNINYMWKCGTDCAREECKVSRSSTCLVKIHKNHLKDYKYKLGISHKLDFVANEES